MPDPIVILQAQRDTLQTQLDLFNEAVAGYQALTATMTGSEARDTIISFFKVGVIVATGGARAEAAGQQLLTALQEESFASRRSTLIADIAALDAAITALGG